MVAPRAASYKPFAMYPMTVISQNSHQHQCGGFCFPAKTWPHNIKINSPVDVTGHNLPKRLTIGNIYRPSHDNNNNKNIETFINEMSPFIDKLKKGKKLCRDIARFQYQPFTNQ